MKNFHDARILFFTSLILTVFSVTTAYAEQTTFSDVIDETMYKSSIEWMQKNEIINGYPDDTFKPDKCINRAEFLKMLFKIRQVNADGSKAELFSDTPAGEWYAKYIRAARERRIIQGYKDGRFRPDQCVNRVEAIKMALEEFSFNDFAEYQPIELAPDIEMPETPPTEWSIKFNGKAKNSVSLNNYSPGDWYHKYAIYALDSNLIGLENGKDFDPTKGMSRKEVAEMLYRMKTMADNYTDFYKETDRPDTMVFTKAEVNFEINGISLTSSNDPKTGDTLEFDVYLERPDLQLKENIEYDDPMPLTVDLPLQLQPKLMYLSTVDDKDQDTGAMCDRPRFPHRCTLITIDDELKKSEHTVLLKITFEDDSYVAKEITVPHPKALAKPEIAGPIKTPNQNSKFDVEFKDIGADEYDVSVDLCKEYGNEGINPCLDGTIYHLTRNKDSNTFTVSYGGDKSATVNVQNGFINVRSDFLLIFEESMSYNIIATSKGKTDTGITTTIKNSDSKFYPKESL